MKIYIRTSLLFFCLTNFPLYAQEAPQEGSQPVNVLPTVETQTQVATTPALESPKENPQQESPFPLEAPKENPQQESPFPLEAPPEGKADSSFTMQLLNMLSTLGILLAVVLLASWALKRMMKTRIQQANEMSLIKILEQRPLTNKTIVSLIEVRGKEMAIAESANGVTLLCEFPATKEEEIL